MLKKLIRPTLGVTLLVGVLVASSTTPSRPPEVARLSSDSAELSVARKRISALETLIQRFREELSYVDAVNDVLEQKTNH